MGNIRTCLLVILWVALYCVTLFGQVEIPDRVPEHSMVTIDLKDDAQAPRVKVYQLLNYDLKVIPTFKLEGENRYVFTGPPGVYYVDIDTGSVEYNGKTTIEGRVPPQPEPEPDTPDPQPEPDEPIPSGFAGEVHKWFKTNYPEYDAQRMSEVGSIFASRAARLAGLQGQDNAEYIRTNLIAPTFLKVSELYGTDWVDFRPTFTKFVTFLEEQRTPATQADHIKLWNDVATGLLSLK